MKAYSVGLRQKIVDIYATGDIPQRKLAKNVGVAISFVQKILKQHRDFGTIGNESVKLTMQHVIPYSMGGETTSRNLVTLCNDCNQKCGVELLTELYDMASLPHGFDPSLVKTPPSQGAIHQEDSLFNNLMQTRYEVW